MGVDNKTPAFLSKWPLGKVPVFEGADGLLLNESNAIAFYGNGPTFSNFVVANYKDNTSLLGANKKEKALVQSLIATSDNEFNPIYTAWLYPIFGYAQYNEAATAQAKVNCKRTLAYFNNHLSTRTFLVGDRVTLADIVITCILMGFYKSVFDPEFIGEFKHVTRWFLTCINQPHFKSVLGEVELTKKAAVYDPKAAAIKPAEPKKEKAASATPAKAKKEEPVEDLEALAAAEAAGPKEKNPLDLLPKSSFILDEWKRFYSNNETRPTAVNWFWDKYDPTGYTIYKVDYKYNNELTQVFMSNNLIGGFYQRLERARKYAFGSMVVLGLDGKNEITGYFVFRGAGIPFEVQDTADYESYSFTKVNDKDAKVREDVNAIFAWDEKIRGKPCADGKIFK